MTSCRCALVPCCCDYLLTLLSGKRNARLATVAESQAREPLPHRAACPCVACYRDRLAGWDRM